MAHLLQQINQNITQSHVNSYIASSLSSFAVNANVTIVDNTVNTIAFGVAHDWNIDFTEDITDGTSRVRRSAPSRSSDCFSWGRIRSTGQRDGLNVAVQVTKRMIKTLFATNDSCCQEIKVLTGVNSTWQPDPSNIILQSLWVPATVSFKVITGHSDLGCFVLSDVVGSHDNFDKECSIHAVRGSKDILICQRKQWLDYKPRSNPKFLLAYKSMILHRSTYHR